MGQWRLCKVPVLKLRLKGRITHAYLGAYFLLRFSIIFSRFMTEGAFISAISAIHFVALPRLLKRAKRWS